MAADQPPHPSVSTVREIVKRVLDAGQVPAQYIADHLRRIAHEIEDRYGVPEQQRQEE